MAILASFDAGRWRSFLEVFCRILKSRVVCQWISHLRLMKVEHGLSLTHLALWFLVNKYLKLRQARAWFVDSSRFNSFTIDHRYHLERHYSLIAIHSSESVSKKGTSIYYYSMLRTTVKCCSVFFPLPYPQLSHFQCWQYGHVPPAGETRGILQLRLH